MTEKNMEKIEISKKIREIEVYELRNALVRKKLEFVNFHEIFKNEIFSSFSTFFVKRWLNLKNFT